MKRLLSIFWLTILFSCNEEKAIVIQKSFTGSSNGITTDGKMVINFDNYSLIVKGINSGEFYNHSVTLNKYINTKIGDTITIKIIFQ